jgi:hypothetical protein
MSDTLLSPCSTTSTKPEIQITHRISHALQQLAGPWSEQIAEIFPFPHAEFVHRSSMWMHVAGLILSNPNSSNGNVRVVFDHHRDWREAALVGSPRFTRDNVCVLKKMTLPLWSRDDYRLFIQLLDCPRAVKLTKHADQLTPEFVRKIAHLPAEFRDRKTIEILMHYEEAKLLSRLFNHRDHDEKKRISSSLKGTKNRTAFWRKASQNFFHSFGDFPGVLEIDDIRFETVRTVQALLNTAKEFENCLHNYVNEGLSGQCGFVIFRGNETAVISYEPRLGNRHVIEQIHLAKNEVPSDETIAEIMAVLKDYGFIFGELDPQQVYQSLDNRMHRLAIADHEIDSMATTKKLGELLDQIELIQSAA